MIPVKYQYTGNYSEGLAEVESGNRMGFVDKRGIIVVPLKYEDVYRFKEGLAAVQLNKKWGFVNSNGTESIPPKYDDLDFLDQGFYDGYAAVGINDKWGLIDRSGKEVIPVKYQNTFHEFSEDMAPVQLNDKWGYVDNTGKEVITPQYDEADDFVNGKAKVKKDGKEFYITKPTSSTTTATTNTGSPVKPVKTQEPPVPMHGVIDPGITGAWRWLPDEGGIATIYNFNADGTYEFYVGNTMQPDLRWFKDVTLYWRLNGNTLETYCKDWKEVSKTTIQKKNDAKSNKPVIVMQIKGESRAFFTMNNKPLFAGITAVNLGNELNASPKDGYDESILGLWKYQYPGTASSVYIRLNADGSYESYNNSVTPATRTDKSKCKWKVENGIFVLTCDGSPATRNKIKKKNDLTTGKPAIVIGDGDGYVYISMDNKVAWK